MPVPLVWDLEIRGAGEAQRQLQQIGSATRMTKTDTVEYGRELRRQARDASVIINQDLYRSRILLAQHPILRNAVQSAQMMTSVLRTATAVQNMLNTAMLLTRQTSSDQAAINDELAREQAKLNDMKAQGLEGTIQFQEQQEKVNELLSRQKELADQNASAQLNMGINFATSAALIGSHIVTLIPRMAAMAAGAVVMGTTYTGALASMSTATRIFGITTTTWIAASPWLALAAAIAIVAVLIITHWDDIVAFFNNSVVPAFQALWRAFEQAGAKLVETGSYIWSRLLVGFGNMGEGLKGVWEATIRAIGTIWDSWRKAFIALWNGFAAIANAGINGILKGVEFFVNGAISALNTLIRAYNAAVAIVGGKSISLIPKLTLGTFSIPTIKAAAGVDMLVNRPTLFMAGEGGQTERVSIGTSASGRTGGRGMVLVQVNVHGSIWAERDLMNKVKRAIEEGLIDKGF